MGIYDISVELESAINANFANHINTIAAEKGEGVTSSFELYPDEAADTFHQKTLPGVGYWFREASTEREIQGKRDTDAMLVIDFMESVPDRLALSRSVKIKIEAMSKVIDGLPASGATVFAAGEGRRGIRLVPDLYRMIAGQAGVSPASPFKGGFRMSLRVRSRDVIT